MPAPRRLLLYLLLCLTSLASAQRDTTYVQSYTNKLTTSLRIIAKDYQIEFESLDGGKLHFQNAGLNVGMRVKYKKLGIAFSLPVASFNEPSGGEPKHLGVSVNIYQPAFFIRAGLRRFNGFAQLDDGANVFREDMHMWHGTVRGFYLFNHPRFSFRSSFRFSEWQMRNQGSWLVSGSFSSQILDADSLAFPIQKNGPLKLTGYRSFKAGFGGGYAYTFTNKRWFFTLAVIAGAELRRIRYVLQDQIENRNQWRISPQFNGQMGLGYNGKKFFAALTGFYHPGADFTEELNVRVADAQINLIAGWRFRNRNFEVLDVE